MYIDSSSGSTVEDITQMMLSTTIRISLLFRGTAVVFGEIVISPVVLFA
jgi:hypothetical protein